MIMSTQKIQLFLFLLLFSCGFTYAAEYTVETVPNMQKADARRFVSNPDGILGPQAESLINTRLDSLRQNTTAEIAVVAVESIGEQDLESFSNELFARWGIGQKENNNGVLVLFVLDQRKIRFEVGYGMEGILPDAVCKRIQSQYMLPAFRQGTRDKPHVQYHRESRQSRRGICQCDRRGRRLVVPDRNVSGPVCAFLHCHDAHDAYPATRGDKPVSPLQGTGKSTPHTENHGCNIPAFQSFHLFVGTQPHVQTAER